VVLDLIGITTLKHCSIPIKSGTTLNHYVVYLLDMEPPWKHCSIPIKSGTTLKRLCSIPIKSRTTLKTLCSIPIKSGTTLKTLCSIPIRYGTTLKTLFSIPIKSGSTDCVRAKLCTITKKMDTLDLSDKVYQLLVQGWQFSLASSTKSDRRDITENHKTSFKQILTWTVCMRKCADDELLSYFQVEAPIHRPSLFSSFFTYDKR
jgi:hypothetical protein